MSLPVPDEDAFEKAVRIFHKEASLWEDADIDGNSKETIAENAVYRIWLTFQEIEL